MLMGMRLPRFNIYQDSVAPNCFNSPAKSGCLDFFQKIFLSYVRSETHLVRSNIVLTRQSVQT